MADNDTPNRDDEQGQGRGRTLEVRAGRHPGLGKQHAAYATKMTTGTTRAASPTGRSAKKSTTRIRCRNAAVHSRMRKPAATRTSSDERSAGRRNTGSIDPIRQIRRSRIRCRPARTLPIASRDGHDTPRRYDQPVDRDRSRGEQRLAEPRTANREQRTANREREQRTAIKTHTRSIPRPSGSFASCPTASAPPLRLETPTSARTPTRCFPCPNQ